MRENKDERPSGYEDLKIYKTSFSLAIRTHKITLGLPKHELYETGSQIRRSSKSIGANIVEGYGRRKYKNDFIKYLIYAIGSCYETVYHLKIIHEIYKNTVEVSGTIEEYDLLNGKIYKFIEYLEKNW